LKADTLIHAERLVTCAPGHRPRSGPSARDLGIIEEGAMALRGDRIAWVGPAREATHIDAERRISFPGRSVVPGLVDAHSHPVFGGSRVDEFVMRAGGAGYLDIHKAGGGILSTVRATRALSYDALVARTRAVMARMLAHGATTIEAKSGYGLDVETELRDLRVIREAAAALPMEVVPTFLGAHALPPEYADRRQAFVDLVVDEMLPRVATEGLARFCDVFCEDGAFTLDESRRILERARAHGLGLRIHAEEFAYLGGARLGAELGAASVDHLLSLPESDFGALAESRSVAVVLPGTTFFLGKEKYAPARAMLDSGVPVAVATDFNAGSCMTESLPAAMSIAVLKMGLGPEEAIIAATVNGAHALDLGHDRGSLESGRRADFLVIDLPDPREWLYHFGVNLVAEVWTGGERRLAAPIPATRGEAHAGR
jgi:imidazolonepropionase